MDSSTARRNFFIYSAVSTVLTLVSISSVVNTKPNFFSLLIALSHGIHILVLSNFMVIVLIMFGKLLQTALFGELRLIEREHVYERSWFTLMNMIMAIAMFRDENNLLIGLLILSLLFMRIFHWILVDRIQYIFQTNDTVTKIVFTRAFFTMVIFLILDYQMILNCIDNSFKSSPDVYVIFGFDFALIFFDLFKEFGKLVLNLIEIQYLYRNENEDAWELKIVSMKIFEITISMIKILTIFFNFFVLIGPYRMPITVIRESYLTVTKCVQQVSDLIRYRRASRELDGKLQDATQEDLDHDDICIICRDEMSIDVAKSTRLYPKKLSCGHVIHLGCLKSWMERSESCPLCRSPVFGLDQHQPSSTSTATEIPPEVAMANEQVERDDTEVIPRRRGFMRRIFRRPLNFRRHRNRNTATTTTPSAAIATATTTAAAANDRTSPSMTYRDPVISLPSNSIILPPDWSILPLIPRGQPQLLDDSEPSRTIPPTVITRTNEYDIFLNGTTRGTLTLVKRHNNGGVDLINLVNFPQETTTDAPRQAFTGANFPFGRGSSSSSSNPFR